MLNGLDPIIIFQFRQKVMIGPQTRSVAFIAKYTNFVEMPPVPIYLSEALTGLFIGQESKSVEVGTTTETMEDGTTPQVMQKGVGSTVQIVIVALKSSLGLTLLSSMIDLLFEKTTSKEYSITYMHGPTTIFNGLLTSYSVTQNADNDKLDITIELTRGDKEPDKKDKSIPTAGAEEFATLD